MKKLLEICTTKTPFIHNNQTFLQVDGQSMGSPLGGTMADFYMSKIENKFLQNNNRASNPKYYRRYVDDLIAIFKNKSHISFKQRLHRTSVLRFTHEEMIKGCFHFLDVNLTIKPNRTFATTVYIKPTDQGTYTDFNSYSPLMYKKAIVKTLIHRALKYSSSWQSFDVEANIVMQVLANNNYPQKLIESY